MLSVKLMSPEEILQGLARRAKQRRLDVNLTQEGLAKRAQISFGTLKLFERTGKASSEFLVLLAFALDAEKEFENLFPTRPARSIDEVIEKPRRLRGRRQ